MAKKRSGKSGRPASTVTSRPATIAPRVSRTPESADSRSRREAIRRPVKSSWSLKSPRGMIVAGVAAVVVVVVVAAAVYLLTRGSPSQASAAPGASASPVASSAADQDLLGAPVPDEGRNHVPEGSAINYQHNPPASGPHYPSPKDWGVYTDVVAPGYWVHNLEHGGVVVLYDCPNGCQDVVDQLRKAFSTFPKDKYNEVKLLATPYHGLPNGVQVMAVSWDYQKAYTSFDLNKLEAFFQGHVDRSPEDVP